MKRFVLVIMAVVIMATQGTAAAAPFQGLYDFLAVLPEKLAIKDFDAGDGPEGAAFRIGQRQGFNQKWEEMYGPLNVKMSEISVGKVGAEISRNVDYYRFYQNLVAYLSKYGDTSEILFIVNDIDIISGKYVGRVASLTSSESEMLWVISAYPWDKDTNYIDAGSFAKSIMQMFFSDAPVQSADSAYKKIFRTWRVRKLITLIATQDYETLHAFLSSDRKAQFGAYVRKYAICKKTNYDPCVFQYHIDMDKAEAAEVQEVQEHYYRVKGKAAESTPAKKAMKAKKAAQGAN